MDSGAFTEISAYGEYRYPVDEYAEQINRWAHVGQLEAAISQDYMCEPHIINKTGMSVKQHQLLTIQRYEELKACYLPKHVRIIPVLQGFHPQVYADHVNMYGDLLGPCAWVGVGSICKRNANPMSVLTVLNTIKRVRPDLQLHGFGVKMTALQNPGVRALLHSADSMAWSYAARREGRDRNSWEEAKRFEQDVLALCARPNTGWIPPLI